MFKEFIFHHSKNEHCFEINNFTYLNEGQSFNFIQFKRTSDDIVVNILITKQCYVIRNEFKIKSSTVIVLKRILLLRNRFLSLSLFLSLCVFCHFKTNK